LAFYGNSKRTDFGNEYPTKLIFGSNPNTEADIRYENLISLAARCDGFVRIFPAVVVAGRELPLTPELDERGVPLTVEGTRRAKAKLAEAAARRTPERRVALLRRLGLPADTA
jgi:hypothetical protein